MNKYTKEITLIHGLKDNDNNLIKNIHLRALDGFDEDLLNEMETRELPYPAKTSLILSRIINFTDNEKCDEDVKLDRVRNMTIGDRTYLMFLLRQLTYGDFIFFDFQCRSCNEIMSVNLSISQMLAHLLSYHNKSHLMANENTGHYQVKFSNYFVKIRLLNGLDQEKICSQNFNERDLLESCILNINSIGQEQLLDNKFIDLIDSTLSKLDPLSDIVLTQNCPSCNAPSKIPFIIEDFFFKEIRARKNNLEFEVHWLALNYHWSESEILTLPISKRRRYVELVNNTLGTELSNG